MTSIFDGMAGVLNGVFGAPVTWTPQGEAARPLRAIFRSEPITVPDEMGNDILIERPVLRVQQPDAGDIASGDTVAPGNGKTYRIESPHVTGSPAADAFVVFLLEELT